MNNWHEVIQRQLQYISKDTQNGRHRFNPSSFLCQLIKIGAENILSVRQECFQRSRLNRLKKTLISGGCSASEYQALFVLRISANFICR